MVTDASLYTSAGRRDETILVNLYGLTANQISILAQAGDFDNIATLNAGATLRANGPNNIPPDMDAAFKTFVKELTLNLCPKPCEALVLVLNVGARDCDANAIADVKSIRVMAQAAGAVSGTVAYLSPVAHARQDTVIGSVGGHSDNTVSNVLIESSTVTNLQNGIRTKTIYGGTGSVSGVTYENITLSNISQYGIMIEEDYENGSPTGTLTTGVPITDLTVSDVVASVRSSATDIYILCGCGSYSSWTWNSVSVTGGKKSTACENVPSGASC